MTEMNRKELMLELLAELAPEIEAAYPNLPTVPADLSRPTGPFLSEVLAGYMPLPREALFLGVADDQLPVLLNLLDPLPGPVLVFGDQGSGKTSFLQVVARGVEQVHEAQTVQYGVITRYPEEWKDLGGGPNCVEIFPTYKNNAQDFLNSLMSWAHANRGDRQSVLLMIDDLSSISSMDFETRQNLRWLLLRGPSRRVWPIVTLNPEKVHEVEPWLEFFHTRLFGRLGTPRDAQNFAGANLPAFGELTPGKEFLLREGEEWLKFWIPSLD
jgi:hypothetical protein